jgi:molecular chaperone IbpA|tara:strand:- start:10801 stop:11244 length:444 start_codon:yes stop_codon:yes gene_type:complete
MTRLSIFQQLQPVSIGFDDVFSQFDKMFDADNQFINQVNYPPYNIIQTDKNKFDIEVALAGFSKKDIKVEVEAGKLTIESIKDKDTKEVEDNNGVLHKGISKRSFKKVWTIADDVKVTGAELKDGLLKVSMEKVVPEKDKLKTITIK